MMQITPLSAPDREAWLPLAQGYKLFYKTSLTDDAYEAAWQRLLSGPPYFGLAARDGGKILGITHFLLQPNIWSGPICYLQDLFVAPEQRGHGAGAALIRAVADAAVRQGAAKLYWLTQEDNTTARGLYDRVAKFNGFIRYDYPLPPAP